VTSAPRPLDASLVNRAAPPGSLRYFALLYSPPESRAVVTALYVIEAEIREAAHGANHDVGHTRLQWWRQEIDRLVHASPQHPATRDLLADTRTDRGEFARLHELIAAADMDLARMTYENERELRAYCSRSGGAVQETIASQTLAPETLDEATRLAANRIGTGIRLTEILRDLRQDATEGRIYLPLDELERHGLQTAALRGREVSNELRGALQSLANLAAAQLTDAEAALEPARRPALRHLLVLAALHRRLLEEIAARKFDIASERIELGPLAKPWTAWRAARRAG
jgi:15-cis-phytoene synthase